MRALGMEAGMGIGLPAIEIKVQATLARDAVYFFDYFGNNVAFGFHVTGRGDDDAQYSKVHGRVLLPLYENDWPVGKEGV